MEAVLQRYILKMWREAGWFVSDLFQEDTTMTRKVQSAMPHGIDKERLQTKWLIKGDYKMADEGWSQVQDGGPPLVSLIREKQRHSGGAHTISSLISHVGVIWSGLKECVCVYVCVWDVMFWQVREWLAACKDPESVWLLTFFVFLRLWS